MIKRSLDFAVWMMVGFFAFGVTSAQAYLDPGTGSMILQAVIGAVAGALIVIKLYWYKLTSFFKGRAADKRDAGSADKDDQ
jgi:hypothetical protein